MHAKSLLRPIRFGISVSALIGALALIVFRHDIKALLRTFGFAAYLASVNSGWPDPKLVRECKRACPDVDVLVPYWGSRQWPDGGSPRTIPAPERASAYPT